MIGWGRLNRYARAADALWARLPAEARDRIDTRPLSPETVRQRVPFVTAGRRGDPSVPLPSEAERRWQAAKDRTDELREVEVEDAAGRLYRGPRERAQTPSGQPVRVPPPPVRRPWPLS